MLDFLQFISDYNGEDRFMTRIGVGGLINMDKLKQTHHVLNDIALFHHHAKQQIETVTSRSVLQVVSLSEALSLLFILSLFGVAFLELSECFAFQRKEFFLYVFFNLSVILYEQWGNALWKNDALWNLFQSALNLGLNQRTLKKKFQSVLYSGPT